MNLFSVRWRTNPRLPLQEFCEYLSTDLRPPVKDAESAAVDFDRRKCLLYVEKYGKWWAFMMISFSKSKSKLRFHERDGKSQIVLVDPADGDSDHTFTWFLLNADHGTGVFSRQGRSATFLDFTRFVRERYVDYRRQRIESESHGKPDDEKKRVAQKYAKQFSGVALLTTRDVSQLIQDLAEISEVKVGFEKLSVGKDSPFSPMSGVTKSASHVLRLDAQASITKKRAAVIAALPFFKLGRGRVKGKTADGTPRQVQLRTNLGLLAELDWTKLQGQMKTIDVTAFSKCTVIKEMSKVIDGAPGRFVPPPGVKWAQTDTDEEETEEERTDGAEED